MPRAAGEMPFLDHLEELRSRILRSLLAVIACFALGLWLVDRFRLVDVLKAPIAQYLPQGRLMVVSPTEPLMIVLKLGLVVGLVLASPVILWQLWAFLSPALYEKERKTLVPALFAGLLLFLAGAVAAFLFIVPQALRVLLSFQSGSFNTNITFEAYFSFVMQLVLALGLSCELPLLMVILAAFGIISTPLLNRVRPYAIVGSFVLGAVLSPGTDVLSMFMLTIPLLLLYEIGVGGVWVVQRRRRKAESIGGAVVLLLLLARPAAAQQPVLPPLQAARPGQPGAAPGDTSRMPATRQLDSASARRLGLPSAPKRPFPPPDSIMTQLLELEGYSVTRYQADTAVVQAAARIVDLRGNAMTDRSDAVLEAKAITYREGACSVDATGEPHLFQGGQVVIGNVARYDTCKERGVVGAALTTFAQGGGNWFVRGNLAVDSSRSRLYGGSSEFTSCDLPIPHYHFAAREIKWVSRSVLVARPTVLYIRDVPIAWLPFLFQDTKPDRHSGILIPEFSFNDVVRPSPKYNRAIRNIGYFWAPNDYFDAKLLVNWYANRYIDVGIDTRYRILDRFLSGSLGYSLQRQSTGTTAKTVHWTHEQTFSNTFSAHLDAQYSTNSALIARNSIDPRVSTATIHSSAHLSKRYSWGSVSLGASRSESITDGSGTMTLPQFDITPKSLDFGTAVTWSPSVSFSSIQTFKSPLGALLVTNAAGGIDTVAQQGSTRTANFGLQTPVRIGSFNWSNSITVTDGDSTGRRVVTFRKPNDATPDPTDSVTVTQVRGGGFGTTLDWNTGINLPIFFRSTWKLTPTLGITNKTGGPFAVRNAFTGGGFINQGKRFQFSLSLSPTFFGLFGGIGGVQKFRHSISPQITYAYAPAAEIPEAFARAISQPGQALVLRSPSQQQITLTLNQNLEGKGRPTEGDSTGNSARKFRVLSISTSPVSYDFEQAKLPGRTGWTTSSLGNSFSSDLLPGFDLRISHDLWDGPVGYRTSKFSPFLSSVSSTFSVTPNTLRGIASLFGLASRGPAGGAPPGQLAPGGLPGAVLPGALRSNMALQAPGQGRGSRPFSANITLSVSRTRPGVDLNGQPIVTANRSSIAFNTSFSPTRYWGVTWATNYNATAGQFESQQIQLSRDLHEWRAAFSFQKSPNGNFAFYFSIFLSDLPELKFDYAQSTIRP